MRRRAVPSGTVGGRIAGTSRPRCSRCALQASARCALPAISGWMGVVDSSSGRPSWPAPAPKPRHQRLHVLAPPGLGPRQAQGGARGLGQRRRQRGGVDVAARVLDQRLDQRLAAGDEGAEAAQRLAQRAHQHRHRVGVQARLLQRCRRRPAPARQSRAHRRPSARRRACCARVASSASGARSPSMLNTPSVTTSWRGAPSAASSLRQGCDIAVRITLHAAPGTGAPRRAARRG